MQVWIDASSPDAGLAIFGLTATERHLRSLLAIDRPPQRIVIDCADQSPEALGVPPSLLRRLNVEIRRSPTPFAERLSSFLQQAGSTPVLLLDGAVIADARLHRNLVRLSQARIARGTGREANAAMIFLPSAAAAIPGLAGADLNEAASAMEDRGIGQSFRQEDFDGFIRNLRRSIPFYLFRVAGRAKADEIERFMFWSNYKGSTDLFTRYVYPPLVWLMVRPLARARIHPNWVTIASIVMTFAAIPFFARGDFIIGFVLAYGMSVLDSVDGKLARLTFTDSFIGNILDHGLDIVHPPLWYLSWAFGLGLATLPWSSPLGVAAILIVVIYVIDRLILKIYPRFFGRGFHTHSKMDARIRTFISRRNINLPVFLVGWALGLGVEAFYLITFWQGLTAAYHGWRTFWIIAVKREHRKQTAGPAEIATKRIG